MKGRRRTARPREAHGPGRTAWEVRVRRRGFVHGVTGIGEVWLGAYFVLTCLWERRHAEAVSLVSNSITHSLPSRSQHCLTLPLPSLWRAEPLRKRRAAKTTTHASRASFAPKGHMESHRVRRCFTNDTFIPCACGTRDKCACGCARWRQSKETPQRRSSCQFSRSHIHEYQKVLETCKIRSTRGGTLPGYYLMRV